MKSLIIGRGEIGKAVAETISRVDDVVTYDLKDGAALNIKGVDNLHICFPCVDEPNFLASVEAHIQRYKPIHVCIWSTVPIGITKQIRGAVHSPVEGRHPALAQSVRQMTRWIGANDKGEGLFWAAHFGLMKLHARIVDNSDFTEFLKLRSTSKFGINLAWADYEAGVSRELGMDFQLLKEFDKDYNKLYYNLHMTWAQRYILDDPKGEIGGHCVVPNAKILNKQFPTKLLDRVIQMEKP